MAVYHSLDRHTSTDTQPTLETMPAAHDTPAAALIDVRAKAYEPSGASSSRPSSTKSSRLHTVRGVLQLHLPPFYMASTELGIRETLNNMLMTFVPEINAVLVAYSDVRIASKTAPVKYDSPFIHVVVEATLCVFRPTVGAPVVGVVNKVSPDHIGLLVLGVFNASIPARNIRSPEFEWDQVNAQWARAGYSSTPEANDTTAPMAPSAKAPAGAGTKITFADSDDEDNDNQENNDTESKEESETNEPNEDFDTNTVVVASADEETIAHADDTVEDAQAMAINVGSVVRFTLAQAKFYDGVLALVGTLRKDARETGLVAASSNQ